jgi:hypothetical protein
VLRHSTNGENRDEYCHHHHPNNREAGAVRTISPLAEVKGFWPVVVVTESGFDDDGVPFLDGRLQLRDGRTLAWRIWGDVSGRPVVRFQGTASSRMARGPNPSLLMCR